MKTFEITPHGLGPQQVRAESLKEALAKLLLVSTDVKTWRVVPTARQIARTKSLLRGI